MQEGLEQVQQAKVPVWIIGLVDSQGTIAESIGRLEIFDESSPDDRERFRRFIPEERERSRLVLQEALQEAIRRRDFWIAGFSEIPTGRLKAVGESIFAQIYPQALPFPFDGFATTTGAGAADTAQLIRGIATGQVDGHWVQSQIKRLQNRVQAVLVNSWRALLVDGRLVTPAQATVKAVYEWLQKLHQDQPNRTLWLSYQELIYPPYGMNASSAGLLIGLLIGASHPPRRIEHNGEMVASSDWIAGAFPTNKHFLKRETLEKSTLRFLSEDSESRWRSLLDRWESEENYEKQVEISEQAKRMRRTDPIPEKLEGIYRYLHDKAEKATEALYSARSERDEWERGIQNAERQNDVGKLLKIGSSLVRQREEMEDNPLWPQTEISACDALLAPLREMLAQRIKDWIPRQSCLNATQVGEFRRRMEKAAASLRDLNFEREAQKLEEQAQQAILKVEQRQLYSLTLAESDDYPRQPGPSESTPVRELLDGIDQGGRLIEAIEAAKSVLTKDEIAARVNAIKQRQNVLQAMRKRHQDALGKLYEDIENEAGLQERLLKARHLCGIFIDTRDEQELNDLLVQLERIQTDVSAWETGDVNPERLSELLEQQIPHQLGELEDLLNDREIEAAWNLEFIYQTIAAERIGMLKRRSSEWVLPRLTLAGQLPDMDKIRCLSLEQELISAPRYLSASDREKMERLLDSVRIRQSEIEEVHRRSEVAAWQRNFALLTEISRLDRQTTEQYLKVLRNPPCELLPTEQSEMEPFLSLLTQHLDQLSLDEILGRIERLPMERQRQLLALLSERVNAT